jgi:hypothetical protein
MVGDSDPTTKSSNKEHNDSLADRFAQIGLGFDRSKAFVSMWFELIGEVDGATAL